MKTHKAKTSQGSGEWYTPEILVKDIRKFLGGAISLDPASDPIANEVVQADRIYTEADNGLLMSWNGLNVFCNPPGSSISGRQAAKVWLEKMIAEWAARNFIEGIFVLYNSTGTETAILQETLGRWPVLFLNRRVKFWRPVNMPQGNPVHGSALIYIGGREFSFARFFENWGVTVPAWRPVITRISPNSEHYRKASEGHIPRTSLSYICTTPQGAELPASIYGYHVMGTETLIGAKVDGHNRTFINGEQRDRPGSFLYYSIKPLR